MKKAMVTAPVLQHFDSEALVRVTTDASNYMLGGVCKQSKDEGKSWRPLAYTSRILKDAELKPGTSIPHADCLSRYPVRSLGIPLTESNRQEIVEEEPIISIVLGGQVDLFLRHQLSDKNIRKVLDEVMKFGKSLGDSNILVWGRNVLIQGLLYKSDLGSLYKLVVPPALRGAIMKLAHNDSLDGGHAGLHKTYQLLYSRYYWKSMRQDVHRFAWAAPSPTATASDSKRLLTQLIFDSIGVVPRIVSDNGNHFSAVEFTDYVKKKGVEHIRIMPNHPNSNGNVEHYNGEVKRFLRKYVKEEEDSWDRWIARACKTHNSHVHTVTGFTPFSLVYGISPTTKLHLVTPVITVQETKTPQDRENERRDKVFMANLNTEREQESRARAFNKNRLLNNFKVGDSVWVSNGLEYKGTMRKKHQILRVHSHNMKEFCSPVSWQQDFPGVFQSKILERHEQRRSHDQDRKELKLSEEVQKTERNSKGVIEEFESLESELTKIRERIRVALKAKVNEKNNDSVYRPPRAQVQEITRSPIRIRAVSTREQAETCREEDCVPEIPILTEVPMGPHPQLDEPGGDSPLSFVTFSSVNGDIAIIDPFVTGDIGSDYSAADAPETHEQESLVSLLNTVIENSRIENCYHEGNGEICTEIRETSSGKCEVHVVHRTQRIPVPESAVGPISLNEKNRKSNVINTGKSDKPAQIVGASMSGSTGFSQSSISIKDNNDHTTNHKDTSPNLFFPAMDYTPFRNRERNAELSQREKSPWIEDVHSKITSAEDSVILKKKS
ncbi:unnamed protein product [Allacma fusca]|uniref:RNA-directed DNA polymerase n=1 Tax=Allacma fusca TaxID=39272 RepID=A0A8J2K0V2_9HEXA|nr:unnamed protein product [Allacma fusca]